MAVYDLTKTPYQQTNNQELPDAEGPRSLPLLLDFTSASSWSVNLNDLQQNARFTMVQTVYVDLSQFDASFTLQVNAGQTLTFKGRTNGYYPVLCPNPSILVFSIVGGLVLPGGTPPVPVQLCNVPIFGIVWPTQ